MPRAITIVGGVIVALALMNAARAQEAAGRLEAMVRGDTSSGPLRIYRRVEVAARSFDALILATNLVVDGTVLSAQPSVVRGDDIETLFELRTNAVWSSARSAGAPKARDLIRVRRMGGTMPVLGREVVMTLVGVPELTIGQRVILFLTVGLGGGAYEIEGYQFGMFDVRGETVFSSADIPGFPPFPMAVGTFRSHVENPEMFRGR